MVFCIRGIFVDAYSVHHTLLEYILLIHLLCRHPWESILLINHLCFRWFLAATVGEAKGNRIVPDLMFQLPLYDLQIPFLCPGLLILQDAL